MATCRVVMGVGTWRSGRTGSATGWESPGTLRPGGSRREMGLGGRLGPVMLHLVRGGGTQAVEAQPIDQALPQRRPAGGVDLAFEDRELDPLPVIQTRPADPPRSGCSHHRGSTSASHAPTSTETAGTRSGRRVNAGPSTVLEEGEQGPASRSPPETGG